MGADASHLSAGQGDLNIGGSDVVLQSDLNTSSSSNHASHSDTGISLGDLTGLFTPGQGLNYKSSTTGSNTDSTLAATTLSGKNITVTANTGDVTLAGVQADTPGVLALNAAQNLNLSGVVITSEHSVQSQHSDVAWQGIGNSGTLNQTLQQNQIQAAAVKFNAAHITADMGVQQSAAVLAQEPGMSWLQPLLHDPTIAGKVNWNQVELAHQSWNYSAQGLTPAAAAVITLVVAYMTAGAASGLGTTAATDAGMTTTAGAVGASGMAAAGAGVAGSGVAAGTVLTTGGAAMAGAITAGEVALASTASVDLINNGGDLGATLKQLGSSQSVRSIATAMLTAGMVNEFAGAFNMGQMNGQSSLADNLAQGVVNGVSRAVVSSAINGTPLENSR